METNAQKESQLAGTKTAVAVINPVEVCECVESVKSGDDDKSLDGKYLKEVVNTPENFIAGKLKHNVSFWKTITSDKEILKHVRGVAIYFKDKPPVKTIVQREFKFSEEEKKCVASEIEVFVNKGIVKVIDKNTNEVQFITNVFLRTKSDGSVRTILDLKEFNKYVNKVHFKMETFKSALTIVRKNCLLASIDLKDAYHSCSVRDKDKKYFRFQFNNSIFEYQCLPQGFTDAPRIFTKLTKPLMAALRSQGFSNCIYIDDLLLVGDSREEIEHNVTSTIKLFDDAGFTIHPHKSVFSGTHNIEFLGFNIDSQQFCVKPTKLKSAKIVQKCKDILTQGIITIQELSEIVGKLVAIEPGNLYAKIFYKRLEIFKNLMLKKWKGNYNAKIKLTEDCKDDLKWWCMNIDKYPKPISHKKCSLVLKCDASMNGWGIYNETLAISSGGMWSEGEKTCFHINELELLAVKICLQTFCKDILDSHIKIFSDNSTAVSCLNKMGSNKGNINTIVRDIWLWCKNRNIFITVSHISGSLNVESDTESRKFKPELEWALNDKVFSKIQSIFPDMSIDLFASRLNNKLEKYCAWRPDPQAMAINAFHLDWGQTRLAYCFPPFCLIPYILQKIDEEEAEVVLIAPFWPTQLWFPKLIDLLIEHPILLQTKRNLLVNPIAREMEHPMWRKVRLGVWRLSGKKFKIWDFRKKLQHCLCHPGGRTPISNIIHTSKNGPYFVVKGKLIHLKEM